LSNQTICFGETMRVLSKAVRLQCANKCLCEAAVQLLYKIGRGVLALPSEYWDSLPEHLLDDGLELLARLPSQSCAASAVLAFLRQSLALVSLDAFSQWMAATEASLVGLLVDRLDPRAGHDWGLLLLDVLDELLYLATLDEYDGPCVVEQLLNSVDRQKIALMEQLQDARIAAKAQQILRYFED
jgi:hypothetical protein